MAQISIQKRVSIYQGERIEAGSVKAVRKHYKLIKKLIEIVDFFNDLNCIFFHLVGENLMINIYMINHQMYRMKYPKRVEREREREREIERERAIYYKLRSILLVARLQIISMSLKYKQLRKRA